VPRITVAVPTWNGARYVGLAVRSIVEQEGVEFELLVVDDRSEDETLDVVRAVAGDRARIVVNSERLGLAGNWNRCVELADSEWVAVFHQDDLMRPGHLALQAGVIAGLSGPTAFVAGPAEAIDKAGATVDPRVIDWGIVEVKGGWYERQRMLEGRLVLEYGPGGFVRELAERNPVRCSAVTLNRSVHQAVGGFDAAWKYAVDWDYWVRAARAAGVAWVVAGERPTVAFRWHGGSETHRFRVGTLDLDEQARVVEGVLAAEGAGWADVGEVRRRAERRLARGYLGRAYQAAKAGDRALCRRALGQAWRRSPGVFGEVVRDPRLLVWLLKGALG
jgi:glycosyltransferase involved in cell wall biosynthesis